MCFQIEKLEKSMTHMILVSQKKIKVDPNIFGTYTKKNQTHLKLLKKDTIV